MSVRLPRLRRAVLAAVLFCGLLPVAAHAQLYTYFGRNKVQYTDFNWQVLRTEHFEIYYYPEMRELAERGAFFAEEAYADLTVRFNQTIDRRTPLIFYATHQAFEQTNVTPGFIPEGVGGFTEFLKGRVVIPADGSTFQFRRVIRHELVHVFTFAKLNRVLKDHRIPTDRAMPLWFTEGIAEYWSGDWSSQGEMVMRDATLNDYAVGLRQIYQIEGTYFMYKEGEELCRWISATYGEDKLLQLFENFWRTASFPDLVKLTLGDDLKTFDRRWLYHLHKSYDPLLATMDLPTKTTDEVAIDGFNAKSAVWVKPDSTADVIYTGNQIGYSSLYLAHLDRDGHRTGPQERLIEGEKSDAFEAFHLFQSRPAVTKDGLVAFSTKRGETDVIHLYDLAEHKLGETYEFKDVVAIGALAWDPSGTRLAFSAVSAGGLSDLYLFEPATQSLRKLTDDFYDDREPAFSPDGKTLVFSSDRTPYGQSGNYNLVACDLATGELRSLTLERASHHAPTYSPDGRWIAFTSDATGTSNLWALDLHPDSSAAEQPVMRQVTAYATAAFDPAWLPNGSLVFTAFERFTFQLRTVDSVATKLAAPAEPHFAEQIVDLAAAPTDGAAAWTTGRIVGEDGVTAYPYQNRYSLDVAQSQVSQDPVFGTNGGAVIGLSDLLGNHQYYALVYNNSQNQGDFLKSMNVAVTKVTLNRRANTAIGLFHLAGLRYDLTDADAGETGFRERQIGGYFALSYPLSTFRRLEASTSLSYDDKDIFFSDRKAVLLSNSVGYVYDNALYGPTGPLDGRRLNLTVGFTSDVKSNNVNYYTAIADGRNYFRLTKWSTFASRLTGYLNEGKEARRFYAGGSWDIRGFGRTDIRGNMIWLTSHELRFPLIDALGIKFPFGGIGFGGIRGALFFDAGGGYDTGAYKDRIFYASNQKQRVRRNELVGSTGFGVRMNFAGAFVLRYDVGRRLRDNLRTVERDWFTQFFFGWDF